MKKFIWTMASLGMIALLVCCCAGYSPVSQDAVHVVAAQADSGYWHESRQAADPPVSIAALGLAYFSFEAQDGR